MLSQPPESVPLRPSTSPSYLCLQSLYLCCNLEAVPSLQEHYGAAVAPRVAAHVAELSACAGGVVVVMKGVEEGCSLVLQRVVDATVIQVRRIIYMLGETRVPMPTEIPC